MVNASANNNKYYRQIPCGNGEWIAEYGRVGGKPQRRKYSMSQWETKYYEKIRKGYIDQSYLAEDLIEEKEKKEDLKYKPIENKNIADIVKKLRQMAKDVIDENYSIRSDKVTKAMVDEAQVLINRLIRIESVDCFNETLLELFSVIPRKMKSVKDFLAKDTSDFAKIIKNEQDLLDVMDGQIFKKETKKAKQTEEKKSLSDKTILEQLGLIFEECDNKDIAVIRTALGNMSNSFSRAWKVTNLETQDKFDDFVKENKIKETKLLFHGSRNENWWSIINTGLVLRPTNAVITGKMFGYGLYFAPKAEKSIGYTSLRGSYWANGHSDVGYLALISVAYGKPYDVYSFDNKYGSFNYEKLQKTCKGANSLHAHAGKMLRNDEIVVYNESQCTIKYLIEIKRN